jgi:hypothetical protein
MYPNKIKKMLDKAHIDSRFEIKLRKE